MEVDEVPPTHVENPKALLNMMNTNIKTMRRIRHTHAKFAALNATTLAGEEMEEGGVGTGVAGSSGPGAGATGSVAGPSITEAESSAMALNAAAEDEILNEKVDEQPWVMMVPGKGKGKERVARVGGVEIGEKNAWGCLQWANQKILEHAGFQGAFGLNALWMCVC